ncbi:hypothetical protein F441_08776, partial [Phytophthora nicotianae CJ01A1]
NITRSNQAILRERVANARGQQLLWMSPLLSTRTSNLTHPAASQFKLLRRCRPMT